MDRHAEAIRRVDYYSRASEAIMPALVGSIGAVIVIVVFVVAVVVSARGDQDTG